MKFALTPIALKVFRPVYMLFAHLVPYSEEDALQGIDSRAFDAAMHVVPGAHFLCAFDIVVGHVHAPRVGDFAINDNNLPVVS